MDYYSDIKNNKILSSATTWMDLEYCAEWNKSDRERQISYVVSREQDKQTKKKKQLKKAHRYRMNFDCCQFEE